MIASARRAVACVATLWLSVGLAATDWRASSSDLVARADMIFAGEVIDVRPFPIGTARGQIIKTRVTFRVFDPLFGTGMGTESLEFLGGEWQGVGLAVEGMPRFAVGRRYLVFARRERSINPIVGVTRGLWRITRDARGVDRVMPEGVVVAEGSAAAAAAVSFAEMREWIHATQSPVRRR